MQRQATHWMSLLHQACTFEQGCGRSTNAKADACCTRGAWPAFQPGHSRS